MASARVALRALDFGEADSESEPDLDRRFVRTEDFDKFLDPRKILILGPKGSGKSALFEMFARHLPTTRKLAGDRLDNVLIVTGTGFGDMTEINTAEIQTFRSLGGFQYDALWKLYIALKLAMELGRLSYTSDGALRDLLRATRKVPDYRIGPMISSAWQLVGGNAPAELEINVIGAASVRIRSGKSTVDVLDLLKDIQSVLRMHNRRVWMLFDKIDEIHPTDPDERTRALDGLFPACSFIRRWCPNVIPRIFIRSDLYGTDLRFTNKSHLVGKEFEIDWNARALRLLLIKRALAAGKVREYLSEQLPGLAEQLKNGLPDADELSEEDMQTVFRAVFDERAYPGKNEAKMINWMVARACDAKGSPFPREVIHYGNLAKEKQLANGGPGETSLISGRSVVQAYYDVSRIRCQTYLSEFPDLAAHVKRFRGKHDAPFKREELVTMFAGLTPAGDEAIERLHDVGVLAPEGKHDVSGAPSFDVPRLYRAGLGLNIIARP